MTRTPLRLVLIAVFGQLLTAQPAMRMKSSALLQQDASAPPAHRLHAGWQHLIVQPGPDTPANYREAIEERGARLLGPVPDAAMLVSAPEFADLSDLNLGTLRPMHRSEKLSRVLSGAHGIYVVEFHPDVPDADARAVVSRAGLRIRENPDLLPNHLLVEGSPRTIPTLANWDEVAYIFPASEALAQRTPVQACAGALTSSGTVGQYIATIGDGWDGPGQGAASLNYSYAHLTAKLPRDTVVSVLNAVMAEWARVAKLSFSYTDSVDAPRTVNILFGAGAHGDAYPFDGPGKVLAHTFYPTPTNPEPIAGDMHFDDDERWNTGADIDLFSVALHEMGHALGLGHADKPGAVMYPYYTRVTQLAQDDINAVLTLYAAANSTTAPATPLSLSISAPANTSAASVAVSGTTTGGSGEVHVNWSTAGANGTATGVRTWSIAGVPLSIGPNTLTVTATDAQNSSQSRSVTITRTASSTVAPQLAITSPAAGSTTQSPVLISGTAAHSSGITRVHWTNSAGGSGDATGTTSWNASIALQSGTNTITIVATAGNGSQVFASLTLNYLRSTGPDLTAPTLFIATPSTTTVYTTAATIHLAGTARDNVGVTQVSWSSSTGASGIANGTGMWSADIPLLVGDNTITVRARDAANNAAWRSLVVSRR